MHVKEVVGLTLKASIMLTVFGFGLGSARGDLLYLLRNPRLLVRSLAAMFVVMPMFAILLTRIDRLNPGVVIALIALSISPIPPLLPKKITEAGGLAPYGLGLMVVTGTLAIAYIPAATYLIGRFFNRPLGVDPTAIAKIIFLSILIPLALGVLVRMFVPAFAKRFAHPILNLAGIALLVGAICVLVTLPPVGGEVPQYRQRLSHERIVATLRLRIKTLEDSNRQLKEQLEAAYGRLAVAAPRAKPARRLHGNDVRPPMNREKMLDDYR